MGKYYLTLSFGILSSVLFHSVLVNSTVMETNFIVRVGNEPEDMGEWELIRNWYREGNGTEMLKEFCVEAHKQAGLGVKKMETVSINKRTLKFLDPKFKPMQVDVVKYGIDLEGGDPQKEKKYWYFMEGHRPDCVYYLVPVNFEKTEFGLLQYVCYVKY